MWYYISKRDDSQVIDKLNKLAEQYPTRGFDDYYNRIRNEGVSWNRKRVLRIYRNMGLTQRRKRKRRLPSRVKIPLAQPLGINMNWSMDFMSDSLSYGRKFRILNIIDDYNREDVLDAYMFDSLDQVTRLSEEWMEDYNSNHPHKSLGWLSPLKYFENFPIEGTLNRKVYNTKKSNLVLS